MEWGRLFKSSSAENKRKSSNSEASAAAVAAAAAYASSTPSSPSPLTKPMIIHDNERPLPISSPVLSPRTKTQIVHLTKEVDSRTSPVANATKAVIDRSLAEVQ